MTPRAAGAVLAVALACACGRKPPDATPEGVVRELIARLDEAQADPEGARGVYELLASGAKANLAERARRASAGSGRRVEPYEMLAPNRFGLRFQPRHVHARVDGARALVEVRGLDPEADRALVPCVLEDGRWRVELALPPLPAVERRPDGGS